VERVRNDYGSQLKGNTYCSIPEQLAIQKLFIHQAAIDSVDVSDSEVNQYVEQDITQKVMMAGSRLMNLHRQTLRGRVIIPRIPRVLITMLPHVSLNPRGRRKITNGYYITLADP
jgi:hypothetical protein